MTVQTTLTRAGRNGRGRRRAPPVGWRRLRRFAGGLRIPVTNTADRGKQVMFYVLWDWQDGRLSEGW